jgi:hypothetical protein
VRAFVEITTQDAGSTVTSGWRTGTVEFSLPDDVVLDQSAPSVRYRLVPRPEPATS